MLQLTGAFLERKVHQEKIIPTDKPLKVDVLFEEDIEPEPKSLKLTDFLFAKSRHLLKDFKGSFRDTVIDERKKAL